MFIDWNTCNQMAVADQTLNQLKVPSDKTVEALVVGLDLNLCLYVHFEPLPDGKDTPPKIWRDKATARHNLSVYTNARAVLLAAQKRWPNVKVYDCGCLCCCDHLDEVLAT